VQPSIKKILICNRGEIARRIQRTCRRLNIQSVAVYSDVDRDALHVLDADEAYALEGVQPQDTYLHQEKLLQIAKQCKADAVHPGYGFLSENAAFAEQVEKSGLIFIGPSPKVIRLMGDKIQARKTAKASGLTVVPGLFDPVADVEQAKAFAQELGYPIMLKAVAGGGGKGMRLVMDAKTFGEVFLSAQREAKASFKDDRLYLEKYIESPRHIEVQVLADRQGTVLHLGERECSIQRRHQKIIEEAPCAFLPANVRAAMIKQALALARQVGYVSVGTVEFILDQEQNFYFLEMNTRLQVEHPVTEMITGVDLVEQMIHVALGQPLTLKQSEIQFQGHAIEARIYAEDPESDFIPSPGQLVTYRPPQEGRLESGVEEGDEVSPYYDPMIAKYIQHGETREEAIRKLKHGLDAFVIKGIAHNITFLRSILGQRDFVDGRINTNFIEDTYEGGFQASCIPPHEVDHFMAIAAGLQHIATKSTSASYWALIEGTGVRELIVHPRETVIGSKRDTRYRHRLEISTPKGKNKQKLSLLWSGGEHLCSVWAKNEVDPSFVQVEKTAQGWTLGCRGYRLTIGVYPAHYKVHIGVSKVLEGQERTELIESPMPGHLIQVNVLDGEKIKKGQVVAVIEAMKMENLIRSPIDGYVERVFVREGDVLNSGQQLLSITGL